MSSADRHPRPRGAAAAREARPLRRHRRHHGTHRRREGVHYRGTDAAGDLEPALASLRQVGARLLAQTGFDCSETTYDMAYVPGVEDIGPETYVWQVDGATTTLRIDGTTLTQHPGPPPPGTRPALTVTTTSDFLDRWSAGTATWDDGRASGDVHVRGSDAAWQRMQHATGYTQRPVHDP